VIRISELKIPRLDSEIRKEFSSIMRHMESVSSITFKNSLAEIGQFINIVRSELRKKKIEPSEPRILAITLENALPIYKEASSYFEQYYDESSKILQMLKDARTLYSVYRLWKPGIMMIRELAEFSGEEENIASNVTKKLVNELEILARETRGIYGRGRYGHLAMNLFAIMVVLWRRVKDRFYDLAIESVAEPVEMVISFNGCLTETLEQLPVLTAIKKPIVVEKTPNELYYLNPDVLSVRFDMAIDKFLDTERAKPSLTNPNIDSLFRAIELFNPRTKIRKAYTTAIKDRGLIFTRKSDEYHFVSLQFPFGQSGP